MTERLANKLVKVVVTVDGCYMNDVTKPITMSQALDFLRVNPAPSHPKESLDIIEIETGRYVSFIYPKRAYGRKNRFQCLAVVNLPQ